MATKTQSKTYGRHTIELWDRENGEWVIRTTVKASGQTPEHCRDREYSSVFYHRQDAQEDFDQQCSSICRGYVVLQP